MKDTNEKFFVRKQGWCCVSHIRWAVWLFYGRVFQSQSR
jgi:hypothetical protein